MYDIAFYIFNKNYIITDFNHPERGNPGIGGTPYMIILVATELARRNSDLKVYLYLSKKAECDPKLTCIVGLNLEEAALDADRKGIKFFVFNYSLACWWNDNSFKGLSKDIVLIPWAHTFPFIGDLNIMAKHPNVKKIINVGREERDVYIDHPAFDKMDYIFNAVPINNELISKGRNNPYQERGHIVTYMGSLTPHKTFHILAEIWPSIIKSVPDAELYVIGTGDLYGSCKLGKYGLAEQSYEDKFIKFLVDEHGEIMPSVHFCGKLGAEKYDVLSKTKVGVPNPTGKSETFCICAVEMQAMGCSVTAMRASGYYDTIYNGEMVKGKKQLRDTILKLLKNDAPKTYDETLDFINKSFSIDIVVKKWRNLFDSLNNTNDNKQKGDVIFFNKAFRFKWLKIINRNILCYCPFFYFKPIEFYLQKLNGNKDYSLH